MTKACLEARREPWSRPLGARRLSRSSVFFQFPDHILKLPASGLERIADCHIDVLMGIVCRGLSAHHNIRRIGHHEMNPDVKDVSLVVAVLRPGNNDARAEDAVGKLLKLFNFFSDACFDGVGMLNVVECDL
jgi:hypothetical protein